MGVLDMKMIQAELDGTTVMLACAHWRSFPPRTAALGRSPETLRADKTLTESDYQRYKVWQSACGKMAMDEACKTCPHARTAEVRRRLPMLVSLDGKIATPTVDMPTLESSHRHREFLAKHLPISDTPERKPKNG